LRSRRVAPGGTPRLRVGGNYSFTPNTKGAMRIEFMAINLNPTVDSDFE